MKNQNYQDSDCEAAIIALLKQQGPITSQEALSQLRKTGFPIQMIRRARQNVREHLSYRPRKDEKTGITKWYWELAR